MPGISNDVEICNLALAELNQRLISSLDSDNDSPQQVYCRLVYDIARKALLASYDWSFALTRAKLDPIAVFTQNEELLDEGEPYTNDFYGWYSKYQLPGDCLKVSAVYDGSWHKVVNTRGLAMPWWKQGEFIYTSDMYYAGSGTIKLPILHLQYVQDITDVNKFSAPFCEVLALSIAKKLTKQFNNSAAFLQVLEVKFEKAFREAKIQDYRQTNTEGIISAPMLEESYGSI